MTAPTRGSAVFSPPPIALSPPHTTSDPTVARPRDCGRGVQTELRGGGRAPCGQHYSGVDFPCSEALGDSPLRCGCLPPPELSTGIPGPVFPACLFLSRKVGCYEYRVITAGIAPSSTAPVHLVITPRPGTNIRIASIIPRTMDPYARHLPHGEEQLRR